jgi:ABC-type transport system involved in multi-copper enzyme maturation permease subunit
LSPVVEIRLLVLRELRRSVRSAKGIVLGAVTLLGAIVTSFALVSIEGKERQEAGALSTEQFEELRRQLIQEKTGDAALAAHSASLPSSLYFFLSITVWLGPLLIALLGFDAVSGELQHRSVRFWTVRTRRWAYFTGKLLGLWALVGLITLTLNAIAGSVALAKGYISVAQLFSWGLRFWLVAFLIAGAWAAVATFISSCFKTPVVALLTTFASFFVMWLCGVSGDIARLNQSMQSKVLDTQTRWFEYLYPNSYQGMLLAPETNKVLLAVAILLGFVASMTAAGSFLFQRRDV